MKPASRQIGLPVFLLLFLLLTTCFAFATSSKQVDVKCPVCQNSFKASVLKSSNNFGGFDADLCQHARGSSPLSIVIWGCPSCNFCGFGSDFEATISSEESKKLKLWLAENAKVEFKDESNSSDAIPPYKRYEIAAQLAEKKGSPDIEIGNLYMRAAWCCRHQGSIGKVDSDAFGDIEKECPAIAKLFDKIGKSIKPSGNNAETIFRITQAIANEFPKIELSDNQYAAGSFFIGTMFRAAGENQQALVWLNNSLSKNLTDAQKLQIDGVKNSINKEIEYQKKAVKWLERVIENCDYKNYQAQETLLTLAETHKRIGNQDLAIKYFLKLFEFSELAPVFQQMATQGLQACGAENFLPAAKIQTIEKDRIAKALKDLNSSENGRMYAEFLRSQPDRTIILPELMRLTAGASPANLENILRAMSDTGPGAINLQMTLLNKGYCIDRILQNFAESGSYLPLKSLIQMFQKEKSTELAGNLAKTIAAIGGEEAATALLERAEKEFTAERILDISKNQTDSSDEGLFLRHLLTLLVTCDSAQALKPLLLIIKNSHIDGFGLGYYMVEDAGKAIEFITNQHFGFSIVLERSRSPQFVTPDSSPMNNPFGEARKKMEKWLEENDKKDRKEWINKGFELAGYKIFPASDTACLQELIDGISDKFSPVRYHSYNELVKRTGIKFKPDIARDPGAYPRDLGEITWFYQNWLDKNKDRLTFNETDGFFQVQQ